LLLTLTVPVDNIFPFTTKLGNDSDNSDILQFKISYYLLGEEAYKIKNKFIFN